MTESTDYVTVAKIGAPHGVRGDLKLHSFTDDITQLPHYQSWFIENDNLSPLWLPISLSFKIHHKTLIIHIEGCDDREQAKEFVNKQLAVNRAELTPIKTKNQYYWVDLIGLTVMTKEGECLGKVDHLLDTAAHDVLVVKGATEILIPFVDHVVLKVDLEQKLLVVDWDVDY